MKALLDQATTLHSQGNLAEAEHIYRVILDTDPMQPDALALLGLIMAGREAYSEAVAFICRAIECDAETPLFHFYLGSVYVEMGYDDSASAAFRETLAREPNFAEAHFCRALILERQGKLALAAEHLENAVRIKPQEGAAWIKLSEISLKLSNYERAGAAAESAVGLLPQSLAAHVAQALALDGLDREEESVDALKRAIELKPDFVEAWDMLGLAYQRLGLLEEADKVFRKALEIAGTAISDEHEREVAEEEYSSQHWNLALLELLRGDFHRGFAHYRARFMNPGRSGRLMFPQPLWRGEELNGKRILVVGEQGFGDVLMMCRFLPLLRDKGAKVVLLAHEALAPLLKMADIADEIVTEAPWDQGDFDFQTSLFDLPMRLGTTPETIPASIPYLPLPTADADTTLYETDRPKVGVVWAGKKEYGNDRRRSLALPTFAELFGETGALYYNLTRDLKDEDSDILRQHGVLDLSAKLIDFLAAARFVAQLDLVITCDTAMAHLAGAMGKTVWVLLPFAPDWRWLTAREDTPWYPTMRLFRQKTKADWPEVVARVREELAVFLKSNK